MADTSDNRSRALPKSPTGIVGLDEITGGGLPQGRPTLICGTAGCGKTLMSMEFLVRGATQFGEPGVFMAFEETPDDLTANVRSLGFDLDELAEQGLLALDHVQVERTEIDEAGEYDLEALFIRLGWAIDSIGAKRVVLDTVETLFGGFTNTAILRSELRRLFYWLKEKGVTAIITGERGDGQLTRQGLEEYVSDCVILLDHRVQEQLSTRRLRIVKYRGSSHGTDEYPFLMDEDGISVLPITSLNLEHDASEERVSTGITALDEMLGGQGYFRGTSILISGTAGTGKTSMLGHLVEATCRRNERALFFSFEESRAQISRNLRSIGINLAPLLQSDLLRIHSTRPTLYGLEMHLATMHKMICDFQPSVVVVDPMNSFLASGTQKDAHAMMLRLVDFLKSRKITACFTSLTGGAESLEMTDMGLSSIVDTWILLRDIELGGERNRGIYVLKSRGMAHSNQIREFTMTPEGVQLLKVYVGPEGVLTGSMRVAQEERARASAEVAAQKAARAHRELSRKQKALQLQIELLQAELESNLQETTIENREEQARIARLQENQNLMALSRRARTEVESNPTKDGK